MGRQEGARVGKRESRLRLLIFEEVNKRCLTYDRPCALSLLGVCLHSASSNCPKSLFPCPQPELKASLTGLLYLLSAKFLAKISPEVYNNYSKFTQFLNLPNLIFYFFKKFLFIF